MTTEQKFDSIAKDILTIRQGLDELKRLLSGSGSIVVHGSRLSVDASASVQDLINRIKELESKSHTH